MKLQTLSHSTSAGWSRAFDPDLDSEQTLVMVFGAPEYLDTTEPLGLLRRTYPRAKFLGCSTAGEIHGTSIRDHSLSVAIAHFEHTRLHAATAQVANAENSYAAGRALAEQLPSQGLRGIHLLSEGLMVNGSELVRGCNSVVGGAVVLTGGLAGDADRFERTWVLDEEATPRSGFVSAVGFYGDRFRIGHGSKGGWDIFGPERRATRAKSNQLFELDGRPALELYKQYLGDLAGGLPATGLLFPLAIRDEKNRRGAVVRTILAVDEAMQSLIFAGDIPVGSCAQLMRANFDRLIEGAGVAASAAAISNPGRDTLAIAISCVGRRLVLGARAEEEVELTQEVLPLGTQQIGFYSYGELSPLMPGACELHNQTMTLTTLAEI